MGIEDKDRETFAHQGYEITIVHWNLGGRCHLRAQIHLESEVVCILSRSGPAEHAARLLQKLRAGAIRWIDHHY